MTFFDWLGYTFGLIIAGGFLLAIGGTIYMFIKHDWRWLIFYAWTYWLPLFGSFIAAVYVGSFIVDHTEYRPWTAAALLFGGMAFITLLSIAVGIIQDRFLKIIGKPRYFEKWETSRMPVVTDAFYDGPGPH